MIWDYLIVLNKPEFFNNFAIQMIGDYESASIMPQGKKYSRIQCGYGDKKCLKNKKTSLTFKINDIFRTGREGSEYDTENFY